MDNDEYRFTVTEMIGSVWYNKNLDEIDVI